MSVDSFILHLAEILELSLNECSEDALKIYISLLEHRITYLDNEEKQQLYIHERKNLIAEFEHNLNWLNFSVKEKRLEFISLLIRHIQRHSVKQSVNKGLHKASFKSKLSKWGTGVLITVIATTLVFVSKDKIFSKSKENVRYELNEENKKQWSDADKNLTPQVFEIKGEADTVIETTNGIVVSIPAGAFLNKRGEEVKDNIEVEIKEALSPADIMEAGLSTTSDGKLLETGGMFYVNARQNGENLTVAKNKGLYVNIPTNNIKKEMMLLEGQRLDNGQINWTNPKPFENKLSTVDILSLNFYPPHFLDSLQKFGYDIKNKKLTDSIYYSLVCVSQESAPAVQGVTDSSRISESYIAYESLSKPDLATMNPNLIFRQNCAVCHSLSDKKITGPGLAGIANRVPQPSDKWLYNYIKNNEKVIKSGDAYANALLKENGYGAMTVFEGVLTDDQLKSLVSFLIHNEGESSCEISPSRIHAIWDKDFNNTILATKEFEERLQVIFTTCNAGILELYIKNMNKKMYEIDSMAMDMVSEDKPECYHKFEEFYNRRNGGVSISDRRFQKLGAYMEEKRKVYKEAATLALKKMYFNEETKDKKAMESRVKHEQEDRQRKDDVFKEEYDTNLKEAYRQLGKPFPAPLPRNYYGAMIQTLGWKNVDAYVQESTTNRTTLNYTDSSTGKKAVIKYEPYTLTINDYENYDRVYAYLLPDKLSSFQRIQNIGNVYKENLNELFNYSVVVMGFKNNTVYYKQFDSVKPGSSSISLEETTKEKLKGLLKRYEYPTGNTKSEMLGELYYNLAEQQEIVRHKAILKREQIRQKLLEVVYPCYYLGTERVTMK